MIVLLDTDLVSRSERAEALDAVFNRESPQQVSFGAAPRQRHRVELFDIGPGTHVLRSAGTGIRISRTAGHVRMSAPEAFVVGFQRYGNAHLSTGGADVVFSAGQLLGVDVTRPYAYSQLDANVHESLTIDYAELGVPVDVLRIAAPALDRSPVYDLVRGHIAHLLLATAALQAGPLLLTGQATTTLVRALVTTAAQSSGGPTALEESLPARITHYINTHLGSPDLTAERIAVEHNISVRHLYNIWARAGQDRPIAQWIIERRLQLGRDRLTTSKSQTIAAIAHECGFADASHFSRRFRELFGTSPNEWRAAAWRTGGTQLVVQQQS